MAKVANMPTSKAKTKSKAASKTGGAKAKTRTKTATKKRSTKASTNGRGTFPCLCGCGESTARYFAIGHDARFKGWLKKIAAGTHKPSDFLDASAVKKLGPWTKTKGDGKRPKNDYTVLRPEL